MGRSFAFAVALLLASCAPVPDLPSAPAPASAEVAGDRLAFVEAGDGEPLIFIHGGFQDYRMWLPFVPAFQDRYRVIAYSRRNHFPNRADPNGIPDGAADRHADDLVGLAEALGTGPLHVVAHSSGALAALFFAARNPASVRTLVLVEPPAATLLTDAASDQAALRDFTGDLGQALAALRAGDDGAAVRLFADTVGGPGTYDRRTPAQQAMMLDNVAAHAADARSGQSRPMFTCEMARTIRAPVLLVNGTRSPAFFQRVVERLAECLPNLQRLTVDSSHTVPGENPMAFRDAVLSFLERHRSR